jgi:uncharacterized protein
MLRIDKISIVVSEMDETTSLMNAVSKHLGISKADIKELNIIKKSLDARKKSKITHHYRIDVEVVDPANVLKKNQGVEEAPEINIANPIEDVDLTKKKLRHKPIVVGSGPAGTFSALTLAEADIPCIILERGEPVEKRIRTVGKLRSKSEFNEESNYCYGEGGAGTFSDGKLTCGRNHPLINYVFQQYVKFGAPSEILYDAHPHIGTDFLLPVAKKMREGLENMGTEFRFNSIFTGFKSGGKTAKYLVQLADGTEIPTDHIILALGHSARDTYEILYDAGVSMKAKPFAMGARIEHPQEDIDRIQVGSCTLLPAAEYKLTHNTNNRGIWTFCMCPGGDLLPTNAQPKHLAINGMSYNARKSGFANAAVVVGVRVEDFYKGHPLDGARYQADLEKAAFKAGGENYHSPAQRLTDFLKDKESSGEMKTTYKPGIVSYPMAKLLPEFVVESLKEALVSYDRKMKGYISEKALIVGLESKTSSPVCMVRTKSFESESHPGLYPTGEGAGYAGGIVSASLDGVRVAKAIIEQVCDS